MSKIHPAPFAALLALGTLACAGAACAHPPPSGASSTQELLPEAPLTVSIHDRATGRALPLWRHGGALYVAGEPGQQYELRLHGRGAGRVLAVTSVDGINVLTGRSAALDQPGYVIDPWSAGNIDGWRKNLSEVAAFVFTSPRRSYAARTGRPDDVGVIGVAMFRERQRVAQSEPPNSYGADDRHDTGRAIQDRKRDGAVGELAQRREAPASTAAAAGASAAASEASSDSAAERANAAPLAPAPALGTGHGPRHASQAQRTEFERASKFPDAVVRIYYDSWRNLVARGVIDATPELARRRPEPFPGGFVPDP